MQTCYHYRPASAMKFYFVIVAFALFQLTTCDEQPIISHITENQIKDIGDSVQLNCTVQRSQDYAVLWIKHRNKNDILPMSFNNQTIILDPRFSVIYEPKTTTYTLQIKKLQEGDTGFYECKMIISANENVFSQVELQVRRPPTIFNKTDVVNVLEGNSTQLECYADGYPVPRISWRRENDAILPGGGGMYSGNILSIPKAYKEDRGIYYCIAENEVGHNDRHNLTVNVEFEPSATAPRPRVGQALQYVATLVCLVESYPASNITWYKDGHDVSNESSYRTTPNNIDAESTESRLHIDYVEQRHYGIYICKAENKVGSTETGIELFETDVPICIGSSCR